MIAAAISINTLADRTEVLCVISYSSKIERSVYRAPTFRFTIFVKWWKVDRFTLCIPIGIYYARANCKRIGIMGKACMDVKVTEIGLSICLMLLTATALAKYEARRPAVLPSTLFAGMPVIRVIRQ